MGNLNAEKIMQVREDFYNFKSELRDISKAVVITREYLHGCGKKVTAVATVECYYDLVPDCVRIIKDVIPVWQEVMNLEQGWLKLTMMPKNGYVYMDVEDFLKLPDWEDNMEDLVCTIA